MRSMTGYGRGFGEHGGQRVAIEVRSVNHRFLDIKLRGASLEPGIEDKLQALLRDRLSRGALAVTVRVEGVPAAGGLRVDLPAARRVHAELRGLADALGQRGEVNLALIVNQPGVLVQSEAERDQGDLARAVLAAGGEALADLVAMRETEGASLERDLEARLERLLSLTEGLEGLARTAPEEAQRRLEERVERLLKNSQVSVDDARLAQEVALLADRLDVTEELVRIRSHIGQLHALMRQEGAVGRRLDFLVQELGREYNTVTSKSQSAEIAKTVVEAKAELEKIREQVQNIE